MTFEIHVIPVPLYFLVEFLEAQVQGSIQEYYHMENFEILQ